MKHSTLQQILATLLVGASIAIPATVLAQAAAPQKAAPATATSTPAPAAAPAPVVVTPEARAAIKELFDVMSTKENLGKTFAAMSQTLAPQMAQAMNQQIEANATLTPELKAKVRSGMNEPFSNAVKDAQGIVTSPKLVDETIEKMYPIYAKYYTVAEIKQLVAFYKSPIGAKTLTAMPAAINESLQAGVQAFQPRVAALMDKTLKAQIDATSKK